MSMDLITYLREVKGFDPYKLVELVTQAGHDWADEDAAANSLEEAKKSMLAKLVVEYTEQGLLQGKLGERAKPMSGIEAERRALADPRYEMHLEMMIDARKRANRLRVNYDMGKMYLELQRSLQATMRQEMRMTGTV